MRRRSICAHTSSAGAEKVVKNKEKLEQDSEHRAYLTAVHLQDHLEQSNRRREHVQSQERQRLQHWEVSWAERRQRENTGYKDYLKGLEKRIARKDAKIHRVRGEIQEQNALQAKLSAKKYLVKKKLQEGRLQDHKRQQEETREATMRRLQTVEEQVARLRQIEAQYEEDRAQLLSEYQQREAALHASVINAL